MRPMSPPILLLLATTAFLLLVVGSNSGLLLGSISLLIIGCVLLWRPGEPPILVFVFAIQWLQASTAIFEANLRGLPLDQLAGKIGGGDMERATLLSLIGLLFLTLGMRWGSGPSRAAEVRLARLQAQERSQSNWYLLLAGAWIAATSAKLLALVMPGLSQPLLAVANLKWAAYFMLTYVTFIRPDGRRVLWLFVFVFELIMSIGGYFASFKSVFFFTLLAIIASELKLSVRQVFSASVLATILLLLSLYWTAVKEEYRSFVNLGQTAQVVSVEYTERMHKLLDLAYEVDSDRLSEAAENLASRVQYVSIFGSALHYVPALHPHENGALWLDAISRPFMPRILFPNKLAIDDSKLTNKYTGLGVSEAEDGTSISIGYMGESYIDFGEIGMFVPIFALGLFLGKLYQWLMAQRNARGILGMGLASAIIISALQLEVAAAKLAGALIVQVLVAWLLVSVVVPRFLPFLLPRVQVRSC